MNTDDILLGIDLEREIEPQTERTGKKERARVLALVRKKTGSAPAGQAASVRVLRPGHRRALLTLAAVIAMLCAVTAAFGANGALSGFLSGLFHPESDREIGLIGGAWTGIGAETSAYGITVRAEQAVGDRHSAYILLTVSPDDTPFEKGVMYAFGSLNLTGGKSGGYSWFSVTPDENGVLPFILAISQEDRLQGREVTLELENLTTTDETGREETAVSGQWSLSFELNFRDSSIDLKGGTLSIGNDTLKIDRIVFSPLSLTFRLSAGSLRQLDTPHGLRGNIPVVIVLKDGSAVDVYECLSGSLITLKVRMTVILTFSRVIDPAQVECIRFADFEAAVPETA